jgi:membrane-bound lytic murein transglycosylase D
VSGREATETVDPPPSPAADLALEPSFFCVQVPDRQEVRDLIAEFSGPQRNTTVEGLRRSGRYLPMMRAVFAEEGLPAELVYLSFVESHFVSDARSVSGAVGLWQFIESTGRNYGLRIDEWADERRDPEAATRAAARHLGDLYARFGDWNLAVAAYNAGSGGVERAVDRHSAGSFWDLYGVRGLRDETCRYVVKFLAAISVAETPEAFGLEVGTIEPPLTYDTVWVEGSVDLAAIARAAGVPEGALGPLNPALLRGRTPPGPGAYPVRIPSGLGDAAALEVRSLPPADPAVISPRPETHVVHRGETLAAIARSHGTTARALAALNGISAKKTLHSGQELRLRAPDEGDVSEGLKSEASPSDRRAGRDVHVVRRGDTVWSIARRYRVAPGDLLRWNNRPVGAVLRPGDRLVVARSD